MVNSRRSQIWPVRHGVEVRTPLPNPAGPSCHFESSKSGAIQSFGGMFVVYRQSGLPPSSALETRTTAGSTALAAAAMSERQQAESQGRIPMGALPLIILTKFELFQGRIRSERAA